ncbi:MAG: hypothetical protein GAK35_04311 [Herbaspirillum frisingense]|uniref:Uncharacterized protein n=1 Tax=Herbaspirillum frisingense TaxID=92645 RepID=A0A7V8JS16_9BURK|nr:MAG: hypothetical protein GAK35_04311 [Herbaspirillum frisingense]
MVELLDLGQQAFFIDRAQPAKPAQAARRRQHHAHLVPALRQRMAEGMDGARGIGTEAVVDHEQHARGAQRDKAVARIDRADADRAGGAIAGPAGHDHRVAQAPGRRHFRQQRARRRAAVHQCRHLVAPHAAGEQFIGPVASLHVQPQRASRVRGIGHLAPGHLQAQPILGQQHRGDAAEQLGFVARHPHQLGRGETRHGQVAGDAMQARRAPGQLGAFRRAARIAPQDGRTQYLILGVQQHGAVHLARQADGADAAEWRVPQLRAQLGHGIAGGLPPVGRRLLRPARVQARHVQRAAGQRQQGAVVADHYRLDFRRTQVDPKIHGAPHLSLFV